MLSLNANWTEIMDKAHVRPVFKVILGNQSGGIEYFDKLTGVTGDTPFGVNRWPNNISDVSPVSAELDPLDPFMKVGTVAVTIIDDGLFRAAETSFPNGGLIGKDAWIYIGTADLAEADFEIYAKRVIKKYEVIGKFIVVTCEPTARNLWNGTHQMDVIEKNPLTVIDDIVTAKSLGSYVDTSTLDWTDAAYTDRTHHLISRHTDRQPPHSFNMANPWENKEPIADIVSHMAFLSNGLMLFDEYTGQWKFAEYDASAGVEESFTVDDIRKGSFRQSPHGETYWNRLVMEFMPLVDDEGVRDLSGYNCKLVWEDSDGITNHGEKERQPWTSNWLNGCGGGYIESGELWVAAFGRGICGCSTDADAQPQADSNKSTFLLVDFNGSDEGWEYIEVENIVATDHATWNAATSGTEATNFYMQGHAFTNYTLILADGTTQSVHSLFKCTSLTRNLWSSPGVNDSSRVVVYDHTIARAVLEPLLERFAEFPDTITWETNLSHMGLEINDLVTFTHDLYLDNSNDGLAGITKFQIIKKQVFKDHIKWAAMKAPTAFTGTAVPDEEDDIATPVTMDPVIQRSTGDVVIRQSLGDVVYARGRY